MTDFKKLNLSEAAKKLKPKDGNIALLQKLITGELEAEGRFVHEDMTEAEDATSPFQIIPRHIWTEYEPDFNKSSLSGCSFIEVIGGAYRQEKYIDIVVLYPKTENINKGGRPTKICPEILYTEIVAYYVSTNPKEKITPDEKNFRKEMMKRLPSLYSFLVENDGDHNEKTATRALDKFCSLYKTVSKKMGNVP